MKHQVRKMDRIHNMADQLIFLCTHMDNQSINQSIDSKGTRTISMPPVIPPATMPFTAFLEGLYDFAANAATTGSTIGGFGSGGLTPDAAWCGGTTWTSGSGAEAALNATIFKGNLQAEHKKNHQQIHDKKIRHEKNRYSRQLPRERSLVRCSRGWRNFFAQKKKLSPVCCGLLAPPISLWLLAWRHWSKGHNLFEKLATHKGPCCSLTVFLLRIFLCYLLLIQGSKSEIDRSQTWKSRIVVCSAKYSWHEYNGTHGMSRTANREKAELNLFSLTVDIFSFHLWRRQSRRIR